MPFITVKQRQRTHQITLDEILCGAVPLSMFAEKNHASGTVTHYTEQVGYELVTRSNIPGMILVLKRFIDQHAHLFDAERSALYHTFYIPKNSGGYRRIDAPLPDLMSALRQLKDIFEGFGALYHTTAFAYVEHRCAVDAVKRHQTNQSRWFLKLDFENFFGNTSEDFLFRMISDIFPFSEIAKSEEGNMLLKKALSLCFLNGGLPQGTPISPLLTNLMMIPIDHVLNRELLSGKYVYTRYADDILISHRYSFKYKAVIELVTSVLEKYKAPFKIKHQKTRYGSSAGQNWNLGVMLNKDNNITIGRKKKDRFKASCHSYVADKRAGKKWDLHDVQILAGQISYYRSIEPTYIDEALRFYNRKFNYNIMQMIRNDLR